MKLLKKLIEKLRNPIKEKVAMGDQMIVILKTEEQSEKSKGTIERRV